MTDLDKYITALNFLKKTEWTNEYELAIHFNGEPVTADQIRLSRFILMELERKNYVSIEKIIQDSATTSNRGTYHRAIAFKIGG